MAKKERTDAEKQEKRDKSKAKRELRKNALNSVIAFVLDNATDEALISAATSLKPGRAVVTGAGAAIAAYMQENTTADEDSIWTEFKLGRAEMRKICTNFIKKCKSPEDRLWVSFDPAEGVYTLEAEGEETPTGWTGYRPVDVDDIEID